MHDKAKKNKHLRALELNLYVAGAGAFGVFLRWLQDQTAFDEMGLADPSVFHFLVPLFVIAAAFVFLRFLRAQERERLCLPGDLSGALGSDIRLLVILRWLFGGIIAIGSLLLFAATETDPYSGMQRVLALLCFLSGISLPLLLELADRETEKMLLPCLLSMVPMLANAFWLVLSYRNNSINSVPWSYAMEVATAVMGGLTFFRLGGFAFGAPDGKKAMFDAMLGAVLFLMSLADERYTGMQLILFGWALMLILYNWIMVENLRPDGRRAPDRAPREGDLEYLDVPIDKMLQFNRLPTAEECKAADEKRRREEAGGEDS